MTQMPDMHTPMPAGGYRRDPGLQGRNPLATDLALGDREARQAAELSSMLLVLAARRLDDQRLAGKTLAVIGFGRTGRLLAQRARYGLEMKIVVFEPNEIDRHHLDRVEGEPVGELCETLKKADFVSIHSTTGPAGSCVIGQRELGAMKPTSVLINMAGANLVNQGELLRALQTGRIGGAVIDARHYSEAVLRDLRACENVVLWSFPPGEELGILS